MGSDRHEKGKVGALLLARFPRIDEVGPEALPELVEENAVEGCRVWETWARLEVSEERGVVGTFCDIPFALFNNVLSSRIEDDDVTGRIEQVLERYRQALLPMLWWTGPTTRPADLGERLADAGLYSVGATVGMVADLSRLDAACFALPAPPVNLEIDELLDESSLRQWSEMMTHVYLFPDFACEHWFEMHRALGLGRDRPWRHFVARIEGRPVATASLYAGRTSATVANVATLPELRRQGIGGAVTLAALRAGRELGYEIGTLFSSSEGVGIYRSLGFDDVCRAECFCLGVE